MVCGDEALQRGIAELDGSGFSDESDEVWKGGELWTAFRTWQGRAIEPRKVRLGNRPELYES